MELDDKAKAAARDLGDAINSAIGSSREVAEAIEYLRAIGYEPNLTLKLEIALAKTEHTDETEELDLTDDDLKTLQRMKIRLD
jgi:thymidine phosphorylase